MDMLPPDESHACLEGVAFRHKDVENGLHVLGQVRDMRATWPSLRAPKLLSLQPSHTAAVTQMPMGRFAAGSEPDKVRTTSVRPHPEPIPQACKDAIPG